VVARGTTVFVRGQIGQHLDTAKSMGLGDSAAQAEQAMSNVKQLLEEAGSRLQQVCKILIYVTHIDYRDVVYPVVGRWLRGVYPGVYRSSGFCIVVSGMIG
jgi:enamine deaminase RidA (YjgF/YER057c/UK114 family)